MTLLYVIRYTLYCSILYAFGFILYTSYRSALSPSSSQARRRHFLLPYACAAGTHLRNSALRRASRLPPPLLSDRISGATSASRSPSRLPWYKTLRSTVSPATLYFILYTLYFVLCTLYFILYTLYFTNLLLFAAGADLMACRPCASSARAQLDARALPSAPLCSRACASSAFPYRSLRMERKLPNYQVQRM